MLRVNKKAVAHRLQTIIRENFNGVDLHYAQAAQVKPSTLQKYTEARSVPGGENLVRLAEAGNVSIDWILTGNEHGKPMAPNENHPAVLELSVEEYSRMFLLLMQIQEVLAHAKLAKGTLSPVISGSQKELRIILKKLHALLKKR